MALDLVRSRERIQQFEFHRLFIEELGWSHPKPAAPAAGSVLGRRYTRKPIAQLAGVVVFELTTDEGAVPDAKHRAAIHANVSGLVHENLLIFVDHDRTQSLWLWMKRDGAKAYPRDHLYARGQPGDLFLSKLAALVVDLADFEKHDCEIPVAEVAGRLKRALDVERITKRFFEDFDRERLAFTGLIEGIPNERERQWYASALVNRLMFIWFLQRKQFLDRGDVEYLPKKLAASRARGRDRFYRDFLRVLFFEGFAKPAASRSPSANTLLGSIRYLNGGLFLPHSVETRHGYVLDAKPATIRIKIPDAAFDNLFALFRRYSWHLDDRPGHADNEINPDVLGYIFEKYINKKEFGAYYTRPEITDYLCEQTIHRLVLDKLTALTRQPAPASLPELLLKLDAPTARLLLDEILPTLTLLDPACGSGAFLVAALKALLNLYSAIVGRIEVLSETRLTGWLEGVRREHPSVAYYLKKRIITDNLYGVDIMAEATDIARLRLFLALVASAQTEDQLEPLPNIDFNILAGNSLIGLIKVDANAYAPANGGEQERMTLVHEPAPLELGFTVESKTAPTRKETVAAFAAQRNAARYAALLADKNKSIALYKKHAFAPGEREGITQDERLLQLRDHIDRLRAESYAQLNKMLLDEFQALGIEFQQATWDERKDREGKPEKRMLTLADIEALQPFHWGYEFNEVFARGGFDAIITNPPWESVEPHEREFFEEQKNKTNLKAFEKKRDLLLENPATRAAWLEYQSRFPHLRDYFRFSAQFANQVPVVEGKRYAKDVNLYKLFLERCFNVLRSGGDCGIVIPSGIYTDLGAKKLRELLFAQTEITGLFGFENRKSVFEGVDSRFKFVVLTFRKGGQTCSFPAVFMRHDVEELERFPHSLGFDISVDLVRSLAPESLAIPEFRHELDFTISRKLMNVPVLGTAVPGRWHFELHREFNMTDDVELFKQTPGKTRVPLVEGKMFHQFQYGFAEPTYWIDPTDARAALLPARLRELKSLGEKHQITDKVKPDDLLLDYQGYRLAFRDVAASTNERTMIACVLPPNVFCPHTVTLEIVYHDEVANGKWRLNVSSLAANERFYLLAIFNSFVVDYQLRQKVTNHLSYFIVYNLPLPRLSADDSAFWPLVWRAARLMCTGVGYAALRKIISTELKQHHITLPLGAADADGLCPANDLDERAQLRAELDGLVAHLYGLTEEEFRHVLSTFPLVPEPAKVAAHNAWRNVKLGLLK